MLGPLHSRRITGHLTRHLLCCDGSTARSIGGEAEWIGERPPSRGNAPGRRGDGAPNEGEGSPNEGEGSPNEGEGSPNKGEGSPNKGEGSPNEGEGSPNKGEGSPNGLGPMPAGATGFTLGAVVTTFDSWPLAARCIEALRAWRRLERIGVIDDHSPDPQHDLPLDPRLEVRVNPIRRGFAATLNRALEEVGTDLAVVFDADAYPLTDGAEAIRGAFANEPRLGLLGFRTVDASGRDTPSWSPEPNALALA